MRDALFKTLSKPSGLQHELAANCSDARTQNWLRAPGLLAEARDAIQHLCLVFCRGIDVADCWGMVVVGLVFERVAVPILSLHRVIACGLWFETWGFRFAA